MARRSAPLSSMCVAYACRNVWGDAGSIPARRQYFTRIRRTSDVSSPRPERLSRIGCPARGSRSLGRERAATAGEVPPQRGRGLLPHRHDARLAALAVHRQLGRARVGVGHGQVHELLAAEAAAVEQLEREAVAQRERLAARGRPEQGPDVVLREDTRQSAAAARTRQQPGRVGAEHAALGQVAAEAAQRRELARQGGRRVPAAAQVAREGAHRLPVEIGDRQVVRGEPHVKLPEVRGIRAARRGAGAADLELPEEAGAPALRVGGPPGDVEDGLPCLRGGGGGLRAGR